MNSLTNDWVINLRMKDKSLELGTGLGADGKGTEQFWDLTLQ